MKIGRIEKWGISIGRLWIIWYDCLDREYGLWFEWDQDRKFIFHTDRNG